MATFAPNVSINQHPNHGGQGRKYLRALLAVSRGIDAVSAVLGQAVYWLVLAAVLVSAGNATSRKVLSISSNAWLELQWYLFGAAYLLAAAYTLQRNEHIRIDIVSNLLPRRVRDWIDIFGHAVMLAPFAVLMIWEVYPWLAQSYRIGESSSNYGGLIVWPAKALILAGFVLLLLQAVSELIKRVAIMRGVIPDPHAAQASHAPLE
jgi:TRAP-type mannitol/chloroaromatic compound transport system permease small subunit